MAKEDFRHSMPLRVRWSEVDPQSIVDGPLRELWAARNKGWVGDTEIAEINRLLVRIGDLLQRPRSAARDRLVALSWVLAPIDAKPVRRAQRKTR